MQGRTIATLVFVQILFGLFPVAAKFAFGGFGPTSVLALRTIAGAVVLYALARLVAKRHVDMKKDGRAITALALLGIVVNQSFFLIGIQWTTATNATIIITTIPVWTYVLAVATGRETLGPKRALGIALALTGALFLLGASGYETGAKPLLGDLFVLLNCISFSVFLVYSKPYAQRYNAISFTAWLFIVATVVTLPLALWQGLAIDVQTADRTAWMAIAFILIGPTILAYLLNNTALATVPSSTVGVFIYLQPVFAATSAWLLLDERVSWTVIPAALLIFVGVGIVLWRNAKVGDGAAPKPTA